MDWLSELVRGLYQEPVLQALLIGLGTFILEDAAAMAGGLLVAEGQMSFRAAFAGLALGIMAGDIGLYCLGRLAQGRARRWGLIDPARLAKARAWLNRNLVLAVLATRFVPGMRLPTYTTAGVLKVSMPKFVLTAVGASLLWTSVLLWLVIRMGAQALDALGPWKWPVGLGLIGLLLLSQAVNLWRRRRSPGQDQT